MNTNTPAHDHQCTICRSMFSAVDGGTAAMFFTVDPDHEDAPRPGDVVRMHYFLCPKCDGRVRHFVLSLQVAAMHAIARQHSEAVRARAAQGDQHA